MDIKDFTKITCPHCSKKFRPLSLFNQKQVGDRVKANSENLNVKANKQMVEKNEICAICANPLDLKWTVNHGAAFCQSCGAPYYAYRTDATGKTVKDLHCGIKESVRAGFRGVWLQHKDDLEKFSEGQKPQMSNNLKSSIKKHTIKEEVVKLKKVNSDDLDPAAILEVISGLEGRNLKEIDETIEFISGKGVLVSQNFVKGARDNYRFYSFNLLSTLTPLAKGVS